MAVAAAAATFVVGLLQAAKLLAEAQDCFDTKVAFATFRLQTFELRRPAIGQAVVFRRLSSCEATTWHKGPYIRVVE